MARSLVSNADKSRDVPSLYSSALWYEKMLLQPVSQILHCLQLCDAEWCQGACRSPIPS